MALIFIVSLAGAAFAAETPTEPSLHVGVGPFTTLNPILNNLMSGVYVQNATVRP